MPKHRPANNITLLIINFVAPLIILSKFSTERWLGPTVGLLLALSLPVAYESFNIWKRRKISYISIAAIVGIIITAMVGLLGLSENWLAARRSIVYAAGAIGIIGLDLANISASAYLLKQSIDWQSIDRSLTSPTQRHKLKHLLSASDLAVSILLMAVSISSFATTKLLINAEPQTALFNSQYAHLRILSLGTVTAPLVVGLVAIVTVLLIRIEKLTGLSSDTLLHHDSNRR